MPADIVVLFADTYVLRYFEDLFLVTGNESLSWVIEALIMIRGCWGGLLDRIGEP